MTPPLVKRYLVAFDRHKWAGLAGFLVVMGLSGVAALQPEPPVNYVSEGILVFNTPPVTFSTTVAALQQQGQALTRPVLLSDYVLNATVEQLNARQEPIPPDELRRNANVDINNDEAVTQVTVTYQDIDPQRARMVGTFLMEAMVEQSRLFNTQQLNNILENLNQLLPQVTTDLQQAEQELEQYIRQEGPFIQAAQDGNLVGAITGSQQQQRQLQLALQGIDAQIRSLQSRLGLSPDQAYASSALSADPIIANLRTQIYQNESQMAILGQDLRPEHPSMIELRNQQTAYEQLLQARVTEVLGGNQIAAPIASTADIRQGSALDPVRQQMANTLVGLQTQRETVDEQIRALTAAEQTFRQEYANLPNKQIEQARLQQEVALKRAFYDQIQARLEDVTLAEKETVGSLVVAQPAQTELAPDESTNPIVILIVGGVVGLLVGGGLVILLDSLDATYKTLPDLQAGLRQQEVPLLAQLPLLPASGRVGAIPVVLEAASPYIDPYERFRSNLRRASGSNKALKVILLTSTLVGEGKTVSAYNLAIASARAGKRTLLVEADLRSPSQAQVLNITTDPESAAEPLRYYGHLSDCIRLVPEIENLFILPSPGVQRQAAAILESTEMRRMLEDARGRFDMVILDTPALSRYNDALLLEPYTDGIVLVTRPGYTEEGLLSEAAEQFMEAEDVQFLGAVINGSETAVPSSYLEPEPDDEFIVEDFENEDDFERVGSTKGF